MMNKDARTIFMLDIGVLAAVVLWPLLKSPCQIHVMRVYQT